MSLYAGVNSTPKKVAKFLIGVNSLIKEVVTSYAGDASSQKNKVYESFNIDQELTKVNPISALTSGKITSDYIGKTVYLSNSAVACQEWQIADVNHDGTSGTVDLISKYTLGYAMLATGMGTSYIGLNPSGPAMKFVNNTLYPGFDKSVLDAMKNPYLTGSDGYCCSGQFRNDMVKIPSLSELGLKDSGETYGTSYSTNHFESGDEYPLFHDNDAESHQYMWSTKLYKTAPDGSSIGGYWVRNYRSYSGVTTSMGYNCCYISINNSSKIGAANAEYSLGSQGWYIVGIIRFGK